MDTGVLIARVVFGALFAVHGSQKLFGWFGGYGIDGTAPFFEALGFRPGRLFVVADGLAECGRGVCLALGFGGPLSSAAVIAGMVVAIATVHWQNGLLATSNGVELPVLYIAAVVMLALTGPGAFSVDALLGVTSWWTPPLTASVLVGGALGGVASLAVRGPVSNDAHT